MIIQAQKIRKPLVALITLLAVVWLNSCNLNLLLHQGSTKKTAILYGISLYVPSRSEGDAPNLSYPDNDVDDMAALLTAQGWTVIYRKNSNANLPQLRTDISTVQSSLEAGERVMFYFSGHGTSLPDAVTYIGEWILLFNSYQDPPNPVNYPLTDSNLESAFGTGVDSGMNAFLNPSRLATLFKPLSNAGANLIFVLDSCNSGGFVTNGTYSSDLPGDYSSSAYLGGQKLSDKAMFFASMSDYFQGNTQGGALNQANIWVLSAAGNAEFSYDYGSVGHGAFTYAILTATNPSNGYKAADFNHDNFVTLQELYRHTKETLDSIWNIYAYDQYFQPSQYLPHLSGNPLDILIFR